MTDADSDEPLTDESPDDRTTCSRRSSLSMLGLADFDGLGTQHWVGVDNDGNVVVNE